MLQACQNSWYPNQVADQPRALQHEQDGTHRVAEPAKNRETEERGPPGNSGTAAIAAQPSRRYSAQVNLGNRSRASVASRIPVIAPARPARARPTQTTRRAQEADRGVGPRDRRRRSSSGRDAASRDVLGRSVRRRDTKRSSRTARPWRARKNMLRSDPASYGRRPAAMRHRRWTQPRPPGGGGLAESEGGSPS